MPDWWPPSNDSFASISKGKGKWNVGRTQSSQLHFCKAVCIFRVLSFMCWVQWDRKSFKILYLLVDKIKQKAKEILWTYGDDNEEVFYRLLYLQCVLKEWKEREKERERDNSMDSFHNFQLDQESAKSAEILFLSVWLKNKQAFTKTLWNWWFFPLKK